MIINNIPQTSTIYIYGILSGQPLKVTNPSIFFGGFTVKGFLLFPWFNKISNEQKEQIIKNYSRYLKTDLNTNTYKELRFEDFEEAIKLSNTHATLGKILLKP